tara:strand:- start:268 stop:462 length:195 start_codon:yes stop_codon:yes gene_type:complete
MPIFTFRCKCGNEVDILCDNSDNDLRVCDKCLCGMKRVFKSTAKPQFKCNGFYETDFKNKGKPK